MAGAYSADLHGRVLAAVEAGEAVSSMARQRQDPLMPRAITLPNGSIISDDRARLDMAFIHDALAGAYWAAGRPRALTERSVDNSLCLGVYARDGGQAGFARVVTDRTFRAHLADVIIRPGARGMGLGKALVEAAPTHPELVTVMHWTLVTADAHGLYARHGFRLAGTVAS